MSPAAASRPRTGTIYRRILVPVVEDDALARVAIEYAGDLALAFGSSLLFCTIAGTAGATCRSTLTVSRGGGKWTPETRSGRGTVTVPAADQRAAIAVALAVVSDALKHPVGSSTG